MSEKLLEINRATKTFYSGSVRKSNGFTALEDVTLSISSDKAKIITIAGESGSGKSTLANAILNFFPLTDGDISFNGVSLKDMDKSQKLKYRREVQAIFQDPYQVYNPFYPVSHIFDMAIKHFKLAKNKTDAKNMIEDALEVVGMKAEDVLHKYPHQLSGGQRQRMMIARAYMLRPSLIVADEPVSMVDASIRSMILDMIMKLRDEYGISFVYITHDLSTAYQIGDEIAILFRGRITEKGDTVDIINNPRHPYVKELLESIPDTKPDSDWSTDAVEDFSEVAEEDIGQGCSYYSRCKYRQEICLNEVPQPKLTKDGKREIACFICEDGCEK